MWKKVALLAIIFRVFTLSFPQSALASEADESDLCSKDIERIVEKKAGDYRIRISHDGARICQRLEIFRQGQIVYREEGIDSHYSLGSDWDGHHKHFLMSLTGHGAQLVVSKWTGGAHCCNSLLIFDVRGEFRKIDEIYGGNYDLEIVDLDHDGIPEIRLLDDFLAYLFSSFAYSAKADVVLRYVNNHYLVAPELMKKPARLKALNAKIPRWRKLLRKHSDPEWPPSPFIQAMTDLIFTGNEILAFKLVDQVWPPDVPGKADFLKSYRTALVDSKYYSKFVGR